MRRTLAHGLLLVLIAVGSSGAAQAPTRSNEYSALNAQKLAEVPKATKPLKPYQIGKASWYGDNFDGKTTASGEPFNPEDLTAAHRSLPMGSLVKVTNLRNGRVVVVRVNDRGPSIPGRVIDLSRSAARVLRLRNQGVQRVRIDVVKRQSNG